MGAGRHSRKREFDGFCLLLQGSYSPPNQFASNSTTQSSRADSDFLNNPWWPCKLDKSCRTNWWTALCVRFLELVLGDALRHCQLCTPVVTWVFRCLVIVIKTRGLATIVRMNIGLVFISQLIEFSICIHRHPQTLLTRSRLIVDRNHQSFPVYGIPWRVAKQMFLPYKSGRFKACL